MSLLKREGSELRHCLLNLMDGRTVLTGAGCRPAAAERSNRGHAFVGLPDPFVP